MSELSIHDNHIFVDENGNVINHKFMEREEQIDAYCFLPRNSTVLELGARYGTVSSIINKMLLNPKNHVAVEPDPSVHEALKKNKINSKSEYIIYLGAISNKPLTLRFDGYSTNTVIPTEQMVKVGNTIPTTSIDILEKNFNLKFDSLVADCEGYMEKFLSENDLSSYKSILLEEDRPDICDYNLIHNTLLYMGFFRASHNLNVVYRSVYYNTNSLPFDILYYKGDYPLGLFGKLGYMSKINDEWVSDVMLDDKNNITISIHAPSLVKIFCKKNVYIQGYCSPTSLQPPHMVFICDDVVIGSINTAKSKTQKYLLSGGYHDLKIDTTSNQWAHSIWLIYTE